MSTRIVFLLDFYLPAYTGAGIQSHFMIPFLERLGVEAFVLTAHDGPEDVEEQYEGVTVWRLAVEPGKGRPYRFALRAAWWLWRHRREWQVLHVHGISQATFLTIPVARFTGRGSVLQLCMAGDEAPARIRRGRGGWLKLHILRLADHYACPSEALATEYEDSTLDAAKIARIPYGVDLERFRCLPPDERLKLREAITTNSGWSTDSKWVLFCGGIERRKGIDLLVEAWPSVLERHPGARLLLVGPTDHAATTAEFLEGLKERLRGAGALHSVRFEGQTGEPERFFQTADLFVFPSRKEGLGIVQMEAQVAGLPCVAADLPGITSDVIAQGETGLIFPQEDVEALCEYVCFLLDDPELLERMSVAAAKRGRELFGMEEVAGQYASLYGSLRRG